MTLQEDNMETKMSRIIITLSLVALLCGGCTYLRINEKGELINAQDYVIKYSTAPGGVVAITAVPKSWFSWEGAAAIIGAVAPIIGPVLDQSGQPAYLVHGQMVPATPQGYQTRQPCKPCPEPYPAPGSDVKKK
jgi:hypothetical protein